MNYPQTESTVTRRSFYSESEGTDITNAFRSESEGTDINNRTKQSAGCRLLTLMFLTLCAQATFANSLHLFTEENSVFAVINDTSTKTKISFRGSIEANIFEATRVDSTNSINNTDSNSDGTGYMSSNSDGTGDSTSSNSDGTGDSTSSNSDGTGYSTSSNSDGTGYSTSSNSDGTGESLAVLTVLLECNNDLTMDGMIDNNSELTAVAFETIYLDGQLIDCNDFTN